MSLASCRRAYEPLVEAGYVEVVYGGTKEGAFLSNHDLVRSIHLTGSTATYDAVVWGGQKKVISILRLLVVPFPVEPLASISRPGEAGRACLTVPSRCSSQKSAEQFHSMRQGVHYECQSLNRNKTPS